MDGKNVRASGTYVKSCQEKKVAAALGELGEECFLPVQHVRKRWSDRIKWKDVLVLKGMIFIRTTPQKRIPLMQQIFGIYAYMTEGGAHHPVVVPPEEMELFMFVVNQHESEVTFIQEQPRKGEKVMVNQGALMGLQGELVDFRNKSRVVVRIGVLGAAVVEVPLANVERVKG